MENRNDSSRILGIRERLIFWNTGCFPLGVFVSLRFAHDVLMSSDSRLILSVHRELARKCEKKLARLLTPAHNSWVPNQPHPDKATLSMRVPRPLLQRLRRLAKQRRETVTDLVLTLLHRAVENVSLTSQDYEQIARETRKAERRLRGLPDDPDPKRP